MNDSEGRKKLRAALAGSKCVSPASIYDPLSARVAEAVGYEFGLLSGSVVSSTTLAAPDLILQTITEYADQVRRILRVSKLSLFVDADNGYGNALNVMRTVQELEHAGLSGLAIEDTEAPAFGQAAGEQKLVSIAEGVGKMRAAMAARSDPSLVIIARTPALSIEGVESAVVRAKAYAAAGVDAIFVSGKTSKTRVVVASEKLQHIQAIHAAANLPIIVGASHGFSLKREELAACGARIVLQGHQSVAAAVKALHDTYTHLFNGGAPTDLKSKIASAQEMEQLVNLAGYQQSLREYMR